MHFFIYRIVIEFRSFDKGPFASFKPDQKPKVWYQVNTFIIYKTKINIFLRHFCHRFLSRYFLLQRFAANVIKIKIYILCINLQTGKDGPDNIRYSKFENSATQKPELRIFFKGQDIPTTQEY